MLGGGFLYRFLFFFCLFLLCFMFVYDINVYVLLICFEIIIVFCIMWIFFIIGSGVIVKLSCLNIVKVGLMNIGINK